MVRAPREAGAGRGRAAVLALAAPGGPRPPPGALPGLAGRAAFPLSWRLWFVCGARAGQRHCAFVEGGGTERLRCRSSYLFIFF